MKKIFPRMFLASSLILVGLIFKSYADEKPIEELRLYLDAEKVKVIPVDNPTRVVIGNPGIIDVTDITKKGISLTPKAAGKTTFAFWDSAGEHTYQVRVFSEDIQEIKSRIDNLLKKIDVTTVSTEAEEDEAKVLLLGTVKTAQERERIFTALGALKDKAVDLIEIKEEEAVVDIDVQVLELDKGARSTLGFTWPTSSNTITVTESSPPTTIAGPFKDLFRINTFSRSAFSFGWKLDLLVEEGKARILSQPRLACQSGKEAELLVGGEIPVLTSSVITTGGTSATGTSVEYKEYGIKLKIKPVVNKDGRIKLSLNVEVSDVSSTAEYLGSATEPTAKAYPISKRNVSTELFLDDGQTLIMGGLVKQKTEEDLQKFPWLGDIPILGNFFKVRDIKKGTSKAAKGDIELFITLTPNIVIPRPKKEIAPELAEKPVKPLAEEEKEAAELEEREQEIEEGIEPAVEKKEIKPKPAEKAKAEKIKPKEVKKKRAEKQRAIEKVITKKERKPKIVSSTITSTLPVPVATYVTIVQKRILDNLDYPRLAQEAGFQGTVKLSLHLSYLGELLETAVKSSSGYKILDYNALAGAQKNVPYPPFPAAIEQKDLWIDVPVMYQLD